jgi:hypothetical protein
MRVRVFTLRFNLPGPDSPEPRTLRRFRRQVREGEHRFAAGEIDLAALTDSVASLYAHVSHADTLTLRRRMVLDFPIEG